MGNTGRRVGLVALLVTALFAGCDNPIDILDEVTTEYKRANNMLLEVVDYSPESNATGQDPNGEIYIQFDRDIDPDALTDKEINITAADGTKMSWQISRYNSATYTVYIKGYPYLQGSTEYTIQVGSITGVDGSEMSDKIAWTMTTRQSASGNVVSVQGTNANASAGYTAVDTLDGEIQGNSLAQYFLISDDGADFAGLSGAPGDSGLSVGLMTFDSLYGTYYAYFSAAFPAVDFPLVEGENTLYIAFAYYDASSLTYNYSSPVPFSVILDTSAPAAPTVSSIGTINSAVNRGATSSDNYGIQMYSWSGTGVTYSAPSSGSTSIGVSGTGSDGDYTGRVTAYDWAGNSAYTDFSFTWDTTAPSAPLIAAQASPIPYSWLASLADGAADKEAFALSWSWSGEAGATFILTPPGAKTTKTTDTNRDFTMPAEYRTISGLYPLEITQSDVAGNTYEGTVTGRAPYFSDYFDKNTQTLQPFYMINRARLDSLEAGFTWSAFYQTPEAKDPQPAAGYAVTVWTAEFSSGIDVAEFLEKFSKDTVKSYMSLITSLDPIPAYSGAETDKAVFYSDVINRGTYEESIAKGQPVWTLNGDDLAADTLYFWRYEVLNDGLDKENPIAVSPIYAFVTPAK